MGSLWMLVAGLLFGCMGVFVKLGAAHFSSIELVFYRSLFGFLVILVIARVRHLPLATVHWKGHCWRGLSGLGGITMFFYCITQLPLATAVTLNYTSPLFLALLATLVLGERHHSLLLMAVVLSFLGLILLLRPTIQESQWGVALVGLFSGFMAGVAHLNVRQLGNLGESEWRTVFYFSLICTAITGLWMLLDTFHAITPENGLLLAGVGVTATLAQLAMTRAYRTGKTMVVGALAYSTIVFSSLLGIFLWNDVLSLSAWLGMAMIIAGGLISLRAAPQRSGL